MNNIDQQDKPVATAALLKKETNKNVDEEVDKIKKTTHIVKSNEFRRCFEPEVEYFRGKPTGNTVLNSACRFCSYRQECWDIIERPSVMSRAKEPKMVSYLTLKEEYL